MVNDIARREHGDHIDVGQSWLDRQLDPAQFVAHRRIPGGPAEEAVRAEVESATRRVRPLTSSSSLILGSVWRIPSPNGIE
ncbi:MAG: hypothetical protein R2839_11785 [Thermomicrobiales bacterium]